MSRIEVSEERILACEGVIKSQAEQIELMSIILCKIADALKDDLSKEAALKLEILTSTL